jgi:hypothetical protein
MNTWQPRVHANSSVPHIVPRVTRARAVKPAVWTTGGVGSLVAAFQAASIKTQGTRIGMGTPTYLAYPPAFFYPKILVGPGCFLTQRFASDYDIAYVINCASINYTPAWFINRSPERFVCLNAIDSPDVNIMDWYPAFEEAIQRFLREGKGTVYVHCQAGMNRSGFLALAYVCDHYQLPMNSVISGTRRQRPVLFQNKVFMNQVEEFIKNGRIPREKNTRLDVDRVNDRNLGLFASGDYQEPAGNQDDARELEGGTGRILPADF